MNVIHLLCVSTSAHIFHMLINVSVFPRVNVDARRTLHQLQSNARRKYSTRCKFVVFVDQDLSQSHINDAQSTHKKIKNNNMSLDCEKRRKLVAKAQRVFNAKGECTALC